MSVRPFHRHSLWPFIASFVVHLILNPSDFHGWKCQKESVFCQTLVPFCSNRKLKLIWGKTCDLINHKLTKEKLSWPSRASVIMLCFISRLPSRAQVEVTTCASNQLPISFVFTGLTATLSLSPSQSQTYWEAMCRKKVVRTAFEPMKDRGTRWDNVTNKGRLVLNHWLSYSCWRVDELVGHQRKPSLDTSHYHLVCLMSKSNAFSYLSQAPGRVRLIWRLVSDSHPRQNSCL